MDRARPFDLGQLLQDETAAYAHRPDDGAVRAVPVVPLTTIAMAPIPHGRVGTATSRFSLMCNLGGSVGIAVAGTVLTRTPHAFAQGPGTTRLGASTAARLPVS